MFVLLYYINQYSCGLWYWIIIYITANIVRSVNDIPIVKPGIPLYRRSLYPGFNKTIGERWLLYRENCYTEDR